MPLALVSLAHSPPCIDRIRRPSANNHEQDIYCASRTLYGLARDGQAPAIFAKTAKNGNPVWAVAATSTCICLAYMNATTSSSKGFQYLVSLVTIFAVLNWTCVLSSHIAFRRALRAQNLALSELPYVAKFQPYGSYFALFMSILVVAFSGKPYTVPGYYDKLLTTLCLNRLRCLYAEV